MDEPVDNGQAGSRHEAKHDTVVPISTCPISVNTRVKNKSLFSLESILRWYHAQTLPTTLIPALLKKYSLLFIYVCVCVYV